MPTVTIIKPITENENGVKLRVVAYCIVSSDSADQLNSYMAQMTYYSGKFENSETETLVDLYADEGISGTRDDKRAEFQRLISDCRKGKIDRIYTKSISRFSRNTKDCLKNIRELKALGISVFFEKENLDTAKITDEIMITVLGGLAQEESVSISQNMQWSIRKRMQNGTYIQSTPPFGYDHINGKLEINPEQAEIVKMIFDMFLSGKGYHTICNELNQKGLYKNKNCDKLAVSSIKYILKNERYVGDSLWQKKYRTGIPFRKICNHSELPQYYASDTHPPIIEREIFEKAQHIIESRTFSSKEIVCYPLSKKIICGNCDSTYKRVKNNNKFYWVCRKHNMSASECPHKAIEEQKIYDIFIRMFNKILANYREIIVPVQTALQELKVRKFSNNTN
ncbi:MAG: recombinase family protein, partial [Ruminococcus flavefaciens]|nr:recombinase family protein [Ruminococcus flavefaciens]